MSTWCPVVEGLTFHDNKHSHKTWMIGDGIPEVAQFERLGHKMGGIRGVYSHVAPQFRQQIVDALQVRWERAVRWRARFGPSRLPESAGSPGAPSRRLGVDLPNSSHRGSEDHPDEKRSGCLAWSEGWFWVEPRRFELLTSCLQSRRSAN